MSLRGSGEVFTIDGEKLKFGYHSLSHHGNDAAMIAELVKIDLEHLKAYARFVTQLKQMTDADGRSLLETTIAMFGTGMGDASRHSNENLPTIVAGGGFKHGQHLAFKRTDKADNDLLLGDLFITLQRQLGIECHDFSGDTRDMLRSE
jgi:hypothetical protein